MPVKLVLSDKQAEKLSKAIKEVSKKPAAMTDFERQNPATKRLVAEWNEAYDIFAESLAKQIEKVLSAKL